MAPYFVCLLRVVYHSVISSKQKVLFKIDDDDFCHFSQGSKLGKPVKVEISPCKVQPCALVRGTNASIDVSFISGILLNLTALFHFT